MGTQLGRTLCKIRESRGEKQQTVARRAKLRASRISEFENGKKHPSIEQLAALSQAYPISFREAMEYWLVDQTNTSSTIDLLRTHLRTSERDISENEIETLLKSLSANTALSRTVKKVLRLLDDTKKELLTTIGQLPQLVVDRDKPAKSLIDLEQADWSPYPHSRVERAVLFTARWPTPFVAELDRVPPRTATIHRQVDSPYAPASHEIWAILKNKGVLQLEDHGSWIRQDVSPGSCGFYWGGQRHIWVNASHHSSFIVSLTLFPYRKSEMGPDKPGEALAVHLDDLPDSLSDDLRSALAPWTSKN